ncbi:MAG: hypothetical protein ACPKPY_14215 [Nitrososphaeraceae archaeon]
MKLKKSLDDKIINYLLTHDKESLNKLKEAVSEDSYDVLYLHLKKLINQKIISKNPKERIPGKKTFYCLTTFGKNQHKLKLILTDESLPIYQKIYQELFLYEFNKPLKFYTPKDFLNFLKEFDLLNIVSLDDSETSTFRKIIYPPKTSSKRSKIVHKKFLSDFWSKHKDMSLVLGELKYQYITQESLQYDLDIFKIEHWQINRNGNHIKYGSTYIVNLPGIAYSDLIEIIIHKYEKEKINKEQIELAISLLSDIDLIQILSFGKFEKIILIKDKILRNFVATIQGNIHHVEMNLLLNKWYFFEEPTIEEQERMKKLLGESEARVVFFKTETVRSREKKLMLQCKDIDDYVEQLKISSGVHKKSKITDEINMTNEEKELYKHMKILSVIDNSYISELDSELCDYKKIYIPNKIYKLEEEIRRKEIEKLKTYDMDKIKSLKESIKNKKRKLRQLKSGYYKKDIKMYFNYRKSKWINANKQFETAFKEFKDEYRDIFDKYEYVLNPVFEIFFPLLKKLKAEPLYYYISLSDFPVDFIRNFLKTKNKRRF